MVDFETFFLKYGSEKRGYRSTNHEKKIYENLCTLPNNELYIFKAFSKSIDWFTLGEYYEGWTEDLIDKLLNDDYFIQDKCFNGLSLNGNFYWDERLVIKYEEYVDWSSISGNISFKPSIEFLRKYKDKWNWEKWFIYNDPEHIIWNGHLITEFAYQILPYIRTSKNVDWNYEIIQKFSNELFIPHELKFLSYPPLRDISDNIYINWGNDLIFRFFDKIDWISASNNNKFPFTLQLLKKISNYVSLRPATS